MASDRKSVHHQILSESLGSIEENQAHLVIGILAFHKLGLSPECRAECAEVKKDSVLKPLNESKAARILADAFGIDEQRALVQFRRWWIRRKDTDEVEQLKKRIAAHRFVAELEPIPDF